MELMEDTKGSQGGGSAQGGSAQAERVMDLSNALLGAQIEGIEAKANKDNADADKTRGVDTDAVTQDIAESIARERNLSADEELKIAQKLKVIQETTNLKTVDEWNKVRKGLDELRESKKVTGSAVVDLFTQVGLDPVNNEADRKAVIGILGLYFGSKVAKDLMQGLGGLRAKPGANIINLKN